MSVDLSNSPSALKSRYYKYLESLCQSNGLDIATLKTDAIEVEELEMFFGGLPALIGLRYFEKLTVLRLVAQDISNISPLSEVAATLEELWLCESQSVKDIAVIGDLRRLRSLYLYDCAIEDGSPIGLVSALEILWIQNNKLKSLSFVDHLQFLTMLKAGGDQFTDALALSVERWPTKLQHLDIDGNNLTSLKSILTACGCDVIRYFDICSGKPQPSALIRDDRQLAWIAYHFPFLERLNRDMVTDKFVSNNTAIAETAWMDEMNRASKAEKAHIQRMEAIEHNSEKISEKLSSFIHSLNKAAGTVTKKEGRRELVVKLEEQCQVRLKFLNKVKMSLLSYERAFFRFREYLIPSWRLECAYQSPVRELGKSELQSLEEVLQSFCAKSDEPKIRARAAFLFIISPKLEIAEMNRWFYVEAPGGGQWDLRRLIELCDRKFTEDYCENLKSYKDLISVCNNAQHWDASIIVPLMRLTSTDVPTDTESNSILYDNQANDKIIPWKSLELTAVCFIEFERAGQVQFDEMRSWPSFEERFNEQLKKLKEVGIEVKLEKSEHSNVENENIEEEPENDPQKQKGDEKALDILGPELPTFRWRTQNPFWNGRQLSLRNSLELTVAFSIPKPQPEKATFYNNVSCLDLSEMGIHKLDGIEQMINLQCLNLADNKISSLKKLKPLKNLTFLDISGNTVSKMDEIPSMINELRAARNHINCLGFCSRLQLMTRLNVAKNKVKSLKGIEHCKLLQVLVASDNLIKEPTEIEIFSNFPKLTLVDLSGNPISETEGYRKSVLCICPGLLSIDYDKVPNEDRHHVFRKSGKVLTFDLIEKTVPNLEKTQSLNLRGHELQMIALDRSGTAKLQHITHLDISNNFLEYIYELVELHSLKTLNLAKNQIAALCSSDFGGNPNAAMLTELEELDLSFNGLNCSGLSRMGLEKLPSLKRIILRGNQIARFEAAQFDFPNLEEIDLSENEIKSIRKKTLSNLLTLNLADNRLKEIDELDTPKLRNLNLANNKIGSCAALKALKKMKSLQILNCIGNPVTGRRVYHEFVRGTLKMLDELDTAHIQKQIAANTPEPEAPSQRVSPNPSTNSASSLPPFLKLANSQSSEAKLYVRRSKTFENKTAKVPNGKFDLFNKPLLNDSTPLPLNSSPLNISIRSTPTAKVTINRRSSDHFVVAGTRLLKHHRH